MKYSPPGVEYCGTALQLYSCRSIWEICLTKKGDLCGTFAENRAFPAAAIRCKGVSLSEMLTVARATLHFSVKRKNFMRRSPHFILPHCGNTSFRNLLRKFRFVSLYRTRNRLRRALSYSHTPAPKGKSAGVTIFLFHRNSLTCLCPVEQFPVKRKKGSRSKRSRILLLLYGFTASADTRARNPQRSRRYRRRWIGS